MPGPYPQEFREDVVAVARARESRGTLAHIARDFGIADQTLTNWLKQAVKRALGLLEAPDLGNEDGVMPKELASGKPTARRYSSEEKAAAVRMVRTLRAELGVTQGTVQRVATQLVTAGVSSAETQRVRELEQENRELRRANEVLKRAAPFFGAELDRHYRKSSRSSTRTKTTSWTVAGSESSSSAGCCSWSELNSASLHQTQSASGGGFAAAMEIYGT